MNSKFWMSFGIVVLVIGGLAWAVGDGNFFQTENKISGNVVEEQVNSSVEEVEGKEIISKRTYSSKTFRKSGGGYRTEIFPEDIFFYDGEQFVELEKLSNPKLEKTIIPVDDIPEKNVFDFGIYEIHKGVKVSIENEELVLRDFNKQFVHSLARPFATDYNGDVSYGNYVIYFDERNKLLDLNVEIDKEWLENAEYPIEVDPVDGLPCVVNCFDGPFKGTVKQNGDVYDFERVDLRASFLGSTNLKTIGNTESGQNSYNSVYRGFIEFDTSVIDDIVEIRGVELTVPLIRQSGTRAINVSISRFNDTQITNESNYPDNETGNEDLFNDIGQGANGLGFYVENSTSFYNESANETSVDRYFLGSNAEEDLKANLKDDFFAIGLKSSYEFLGSGGEEGYLEFAGEMGEDSYYPIKLIVEHGEGPCDPEMDNWECNRTCSFYYGDDPNPSAKVSNAYSFDSVGGGRINVWSEKGDKVLVFNPTSNLWRFYDIEDTNNPGFIEKVDTAYLSPFGNEYGDLHWWEDNKLQIVHNNETTNSEDKFKDNYTASFSPTHGYYSPYHDKVLLADGLSFYSFNGSDFQDTSLGEIGCFDYDFMNTSGDLLNVDYEVKDYDFDSYIYSVAMDSNEAVWDECVYNPFGNDDWYVEEAYCNGANVDTKKIFCNYGCEDGKCVPETGYKGIQNYSIEGPETSIYGNCTLELKGGVNFWFRTGFGEQQIFVYKGGKIYLSDSAGFNKWEVR